MGFSILDLSKVLMYEFHYHYLKRKHGFNAQLLFINTDFLCYEVKIHDIYGDMSEDRDSFDCS